MSGGSRAGQVGHLLLVVQFAVELLVAIEAGRLQGLLAGRTLDALLMPQAVVQAQQEPVRNDSLAPFTHRLGGRGSACGKDPGQGWVRERWMGRQTGHRMDGGSHSFRLPPAGWWVGGGRGVCGVLLRDPVGTCALGELRGGNIVHNFVPFRKTAAEPQLGERAIVRNGY